MIKMIITDLDGTLLRDDKTVSERNRLVLSRCRAMGIKVVFATGRSYQTRIVPEDWFDGFACSNGAYAFADDAVVYQCPIDDDTARIVFESCGKRHIKTGTMAVGQIGVSDLKPGDADYIRAILPEGLYLIVLREGFGQIMRKEATKQRAVEALARYWGIDQCDTVAFGDDVNDISLLTWAGTGIAMGNALDDVKAVADAVCRSNEDDGLAAWLEENIQGLKVACSC